MILAAALCILLSIDKKLALAAFALVPFMIVYAYFFNKKMKQTFRINRKKIAAINEQIEDNLSGIRVVKSFANEQLENEKFEIGNKAFLEAKKNNYKYMGGYNAGLIGFNTMINLVAERGIADRFHFPGFMKGKQVYEVYKNSDVFVMPSVSEPFGIAPLEAMQCGTPSIISKQSGCGEILDKVIKTDYWDIHAMADAIYSLCTNQSLFEYLRDEGKKEVDGITWEKVGLRIRALYEDVLRNYGK